MDDLSNRAPDALSLITAGDRSDASSHMVQLYDDESSIVDAITQYVGAGLAVGEAAIVVATHAHITSVDNRLRSSGFDIDIARSQQRFITLDAAETLASFLVNGRPDQTRFNQVIGGKVAQAAGQFGRVRVFGEMVSILWNNGNRDAALRLEELWNDLVQEQQFTLLCGYSMDGFREATDADPLLKVCFQHSMTIPVASDATLQADGLRLQAIAQLQQKARALETEIAKRKWAQENLARSERELSDFFENAAMALHWIGPDGTILRANRAELELCGYSYDEYIGRHISEFHVDRPVIEDILKRLSRAESLTDYEARLRCKDGSIKHVSINSNVYFENGQFIHTRCFTRDISDRKQAEEERKLLLESERQARRDAEAASRAKDEFLSIVSHELRTPLAGMLGWVNVLKIGTSGDRAAKALETIERCGRAQVQLIDDLLDSFRVITGQIRLDLSLVALPVLMQEVVDSIRPSYESKGVQLQAHLDSNAGPINGDTERLRQIAVNLLSNAVKFTPAGGVVEFRLEKHEGNARLQVRDTGRGISAEFLPFIFDRFGHTDNAASRPKGGLGLGLGIARHLVQLHHGTIDAQSEGEGCGATFTVLFPLAMSKSKAGMDRRTEVS